MTEQGFRALHDSIPKPRVAGSIPAGGTEEKSRSFRGAIGECSGPPRSPPRRRFHVNRYEPLAWARGPAQSRPLGCDGLPASATVGSMGLGRGPEGSVFQFDPVSPLVDSDDPTIRFRAQRELLLRSIGKLLTPVAQVLPGGVDPPSRATSRRRRRTAGGSRYRSR